MKKDIFVVLGRNSTKKILEFLDEHESVQYKDVRQFASPFSLSKILKELMDFDLIKGYYVYDTKKEWLHLTQKGEKVLECLRELETLFKSS